VTDAEKRGAPISATSPIRARAHWLLNELDQAAQYSQLAIQHAASPQSPLGGAPTAQATAAVLEIYARCQMRIVQSPIPTKDYPALALTRAHQAWQAIALHPFCSETQRKSHIDLLQYVGARRAAGQAIRTGIAKIPTSNLLHDEYRKQVLWESGWPGLANAYQDIPTSGASASAIHWYAGYAALLAAEGHLRHATGNDADPVYVRAIEAFIKSAQSNAAYQQSANHYAALGHGGRAKLALDQRSYAKAVDAILAGAALAPKTFSTPDGLQNTMQRTTRRLRRRISGQKSLLAKLNQGLDEIGIAKQP
jgi:tetratricopeptide (TPR) repeat protein